MKRVLFTVCLLASFVFLSLSAVAQRVETEGELFNKISKLTQTKKADDQEKAYKLSKTFLQKFGSGDSAEVKKIKEFVANYEMVKLGNLVDGGKTAEAFAFGKEILAANPENARVLMILAYAGHQASTTKQDKSFAKDSIEFAKTSVKLFGENKLPKDFAPFADQSEATAMMYYVVGSFLIDSDMPEAANNFYKVITIESKVKNTAYPYYIIAFNLNNKFTKKLDEYNAKHGKKATEDDAMRADGDKLEKLAGAMMEYYARAAKLGETEKNPNAAGWKARFSQVYVALKQSETGMNEYYDKILTQPLTDPSTF